MEIENVEQLLNYVFDESDIPEEPSMREYKKLTRIMSVMVRFYQRGETSKKVQYDAVKEELDKIEFDLEMLARQREVLAQFPAFHPKRKDYENQLDEEKENILRAKKSLTSQAAKFHDLFVWGGGIVDSMNWLEKNLKHYANQELNTTFDLEPITLTVDEYRKYRRGLDEVTYNLQESQDFFEASLDGRLKKYHQIEKCMIEAQLGVLRSYPQENARRQYMEGELSKDLEFVVSNMEENPKVHRHRLRMQEMHKDFFSILKWQRRKLATMIEDEPHKIMGDVAKLKEDLASNSEKLFQSKFNPDQAKEKPVPSVSGCPVAHNGPVTVTISTTKPEVIAAKKEQGLIHKVFDT